MSGSGAPRTDGRRAALALIGAYLLLVAPLVWMGAGGTSEARDQSVYHLPVVEAMVAQWPRVDIVNYESATAPGYHLLLAAAWRATGSRGAIFALNAAVSLGLLLVVLRLVVRFAPGWGALALVAPLLLNPYLLGGAVWLTTDNAALLLVAMALSGACAGISSAGRSAAVGVLASGAVFVRQIHVWLAAPLVLAGLLTSPAARWLPVWVRRETGTESDERGSWRALALSCASAAAPVAVVAALVWAWGGLTPRAIGFAQVHAGGPNPASPAFMLTLCALFGVPMLTMVERLGALALERRAGLVIAGVLGLALALIPQTSYQELPRAFGWVWRVIGLTPTVGERSVLVTLGAPVGAMVLWLLQGGALRAGRGRAGAVLMVSVVCWVAAQSANSMAWQRYFDPMVLMSLAWLTALGVREGARASWRRASGPIALALVQGALSAATLYREAIGEVMGR
ncbi:MAG TPA: hypothetical protein DEB06_02325 [Phycisphaerales bacterium]|nr:hypothetical protein [Phycisphaerales bacterium]